MNLGTEEVCAASASQVTAHVLLMLQPKCAAAQLLLMQVRCC